MAKIQYCPSSDTITVSMENSQSYDSLTKREPDRLKNVAGLRVESDTDWIKTLGKKCIMHKSTDCERMRQMCRSHTGDTYPPVDVANIFEHLRE